MKVGFTGTRRGLAYSQKITLKGVIASLGITEFHHGDCVGADLEAHHICRELVSKAKIISHPPKNEIHRAHAKVDESRPQREYMVRNQDIVRDTETLIATPKEMNEQQRSGTWSTVRCAMRANKPIIIVRPNGTIKRR